MGCLRVGVCVTMSAWAWERVSGRARVRVCAHIRLARGIGRFTENPEPKPRNADPLVASKVSLSAAANTTRFFLQRRRQQRRRQRQRRRRQRRRRRRQRRRGQRRRRRWQWHQRFRFIRVAANLAAKKYNQLSFNQRNGCSRKNSISNSSSRSEIRFKRWQQEEETLKWLNCELNRSTGGEKKTLGQIVQSVTASNGA